MDTLIGFLLGLLAASISDALKRFVEKRRLVRVFQAEVKRSWRFVNMATGVPDGDIYGRLIVNFRGLEDIDIAGTPEYHFEVCNVKLFETEGVALAMRLTAQVEGTSGKCSRSCVMLKPLA